MAALRAGVALLAVLAGQTAICACTSGDEKGSDDDAAVTDSAADTTGETTPLDAAVSETARTDAQDANDATDGAPDGGGSTHPSLVLHGGFAGTVPYPDFVAANADFIDTLPFDGLIVHLGAVSGSVMNEKRQTYDTVAAALAPLKTKRPKKAVENLAIVFSDRPADFFDDWTVPTQNFRDAARAVKDAGLVGIAFDDEQYYRKWGNYPDDVSYASTKTLADYQAQVRQRGREIMAGMIAEFPAIVVVVFHGPYVSEPKSPAPLPDVAAFNELLGPMFVGFVEAAQGTSARVVDGGELYGLRTKADFLAAYQFRKIDLASAKVDCAFIPSALRPAWPGSVSVGFGLYDRDEKPGFPLLDVSVVRTNVGNALHQTDEWVWFYTEKIDFLKPTSAGGAPSAWIDAVQQGKDDGLAGWKPPWP